MTHTPARPRKTTLSRPAPLLEALTWGPYFDALCVHPLDPRDVHRSGAVHALDRDGDFLLVHLAPDEGVHVDFSLTAGIRIGEELGLLDDRTVLQQLDPP